MTRGVVSRFMDGDGRARAVRAALVSAAFLREDRLVAAQIESRRAVLLADPSPTNTRLPHQEPATLPLNEIVERVGKRGTWTRFLFGLTRRVGAETVMELGTSVGLSTSYLAAATEGHVHTLEGVPGIAEIAQSTVRVVGVSDRVTIHVGRFKDTLPELVSNLPQLDLVFIDGDHHGKPTLDYLNLIRPSLSLRSVVIFDDIRWSVGMREAWGTISSRSDTGIAIDLGRLGVWGPSE